MRRCRSRKGERANRYSIVRFHLPLTCCTASGEVQQYQDIKASNEATFGEGTPLPCNACLCARWSWPCLRATPKPLANARTSPLVRSPAYRSLTPTPFARLPLRTSHPHARPAIHPGTQSPVPVPPCPSNTDSMPTYTAGLDSVLFMLCHEYLLGTTRPVRAVPNTLRQAPRPGTPANPIIPSAPSSHGGARPSPLPPQQELPERDPPDLLRVQLRYRLRQLAGAEWHAQVAQQRCGGRRKGPRG